MGDDNVIDWLLEDNNPAIQYRTKVELLNEKADKDRVIKYVNEILPIGWQDTKGLWYIYYLTTIAECGLCYKDLELYVDKAVEFDTTFGCDCGSFMRLRALIMMGLYENPRIQNIISNISLLPDGGFLCMHRVNNMKYTPKSCVKSNNLALMFFAEAKKRGINSEITDNFLLYFWNHKLFYKSTDLTTLILNAREGWRTIDTFYPFEVMRVGLQNVEAFCSLGYGNDERLNEAWNLLNSKKTEAGKILLEGTLSKSYLPKERVGKPSKWVTFYTLLAEKEKKIGV